MGRTVNKTKQVAINYTEIAVELAKAGKTQNALCKACGHHSSWYGKARDKEQKLFANDEAAICEFLGKPKGYFIMGKKNTTEKVKLDSAKLQAEADKYKMSLETIALVIGEDVSVEEVSAETEKKICELLKLAPKSLIKTKEEEPKTDIANNARELAELTTRIAQIQAMLNKPNADVVAKITDNYLEIATMVEQTINKKLEELKPLKEFAQVYMDNYNKDLLAEYLKATNKKRVTERDTAHLFGKYPMEYRTKIAGMLGGVKGQTTGFDKMTYWDFN